MKVFFINSTQNVLSYHLYISTVSSSEYRGFVYFKSKIISYKFICVSSLYSNLLTDIFLTYIPYFVPLYNIHTACNTERNFPPCYFTP